MNQMMSFGRQESISADTEVRHDPVHDEHEVVLTCAVYDRRSERVRPSWGTLAMLTPREVLFSVRLQRPCRCFHSHWRMRWPIRWSDGTNGTWSVESCPAP